MPPDSAPIPDPNPMTPTPEPLVKQLTLDEIEAKSLRYGNGALVVVPLTSGRLAVFDRAFELIEIVDETPSITELGLISVAAHARLSRLSRLAAESRYLGEPDEKALARDLRRSRSEPALPREPRGSRAVELL